MSIRLVVVTDEPNVLETIKLCVGMRWPGSAVTPARDRTEAASLVRAEEPDAVVLDLGLVRDEPLQVLEGLRQVSGAPVLLVGHPGDESRAARGLEVGADAYLIAPLSPLEVMAKINALLRRVQRSQR
ncbi:MAG: response regulator transcription factor [Chloroflexi bacterium]|nr:response regulator transcription factor [Chloroflexota bacterium]